MKNKGFTLGEICNVKLKLEREKDDAVWAIEIVNKVIHYKNKMKNHKRTMMLNDK